MAWFKVDDKLHAHRKTRKVRKSDPSKVRDAAPFGLWVLAGSWAGDNGSGGFIPLDILEEFDDYAAEYASRLVDAGLWWKTEVDGEEGYGFHDWDHYTPRPEGVDDPALSGRLGNHIRWHVKRGQFDPNCPNCNESIGANRGDIGGDDRGDTESASGANRVPVPVPTRTRPEPDNNIAHAGALAVIDSRPDDFKAFWQTYPKRIGKGQAQKAWAAAIKKADPAVIIVAAARYADWTRTGVSDPKFIAHPSTWLNGERWEDDLPDSTPTKSNRQSETDALFGRALERAKAKEMNQ